MKNVNLVPSLGHYLFIKQGYRNNRRFVGILAVCKMSKEGGGVIGFSHEKKSQTSICISYKDIIF